jgi:hypothetical protein
MSDSLLSAEEVVDRVMRNPILEDEVFIRHVARLRSSLTAHSKDTICDFITTNTYLRGAPFSFKDHEYQQFILEDKSKDKVVIKSAQMGISEMSARMALAMGNLIDGFSTIYTLPSALAAANFMKTRIDPIITSSPYLQDAVSKALDNTMIKRFGESYLYLKGAQVDSQAISVPADMLIGDEIDNSNQDVLTLFESRLIHSAHALTVKLSTPSIPNYGVHLAYNQSRRHVHMCKCKHCNTWFEPDYFAHVKIPKFKGEIGDIVKATFSDPVFLWQQAYVACPKCAKPADLSEPHRQWVCENPLDNYVAAGFKVSPFSCPKIILPSALVKSSVDYARKQDFYNQRLGMPLEDADSTLTADELRNCHISDYVGSGAITYVMGLDMGTYCHCTIAAVLPDDQLVVVHRERIPLFTVVERREELARGWNVRLCVVDHGPYTETVYRMQQRDRGVFAGVYVRSKGIDMYKIKDVEEDKEKGQQELKQANIARDKVFDLIMLMIRAGNIKCVSSDENDLWVEQLQDMKRVREFVNDELVFVWNKVTGNDHYHHSLLYAFIASRILGVIGNSLPLSALMAKFKVSQQQ